MLLYTSDTLEQWRFQGYLFRTGEEETLCECPHLYAFGEDWYALLYSPSGPVRYFTGTINGKSEFHPEEQGTVDPGGREGYYASTGFVDEAGCRILWGWLPEASRGQDFQAELDWAGVMSLPRQVKLKNNGKPGFGPVPELEQLREKGYRSGNLSITSDGLDIGAGSRAFELEVTLEIGETSPLFRISVLRSADGEEHTDIVVDCTAQSVAIDRSRSSLFPDTHKSPVCAHLPREANGLVQVRVFVDHSVMWEMRSAKS